MRLQSLFRPLCHSTTGHPSPGVYICTSPRKEGRSIPLLCRNGLVLAVPPPSAATSRPVSIPLPTRNRNTISHLLPLLSSLLRYPPILNCTIAYCRGPTPSSQSFRSIVINRPRHVFTACPPLFDLFHGHVALCRPGTWAHPQQPLHSMPARESPGDLWHDEAARRCYEGC